MAQESRLFRNELGSQQCPEMNLILPGGNHGSPIVMLTLTPSAAGFR
jgi:hypothetical protein